MTMRGWVSATTTALLVLAHGGAAAEKRDNKPAPGVMEGATLLKEIAPERGFVDDPVRFDGAGGRLLYVHSDAGELCEANLVDLGQGAADLATIDLAKLTIAPVDVDFALGGDVLFVTYLVGVGDDARKAAALVERKADGSAKVVRTFGPATDVALTYHDGAPVVAAYAQTRKRSKKGEWQVKHEVELRALDTGKRVGKKAVLDADETGYVKKLDFRILYWRDGYLRAVGIKGGTWDRKEDQRSPDHEAWFDLAQGIFSKRLAIADLVEHTQLAQLLAEHANESRFLTVKRDLSGVVRFADDARADVALAEPMHHYDPASLRYQRTPDGGFYFSLTIDPVNPDAVARQKAEPKWLDLYRLGAGATQAERVARLLVGDRPVAWVASAGHVAVLYKHKGFSRGGKRLLLYRLDE
jgi:hypothetical protein